MRYIAFLCAFYVGMGHLRMILSYAAGDPWDRRTLSRIWPGENGALKM